MQGIIMTCAAQTTKCACTIWESRCQKGKRPSSSVRRTKRHDTTTAFQVPPNLCWLIRREELLGMYSPYKISPIRINCMYVNATWFDEHLASHENLVLCWWMWRKVVWTLWLYFLANEARSHTEESHRHFALEVAWHCHFQELTCRCVSDLLACSPIWKILYEQSPDSNVSMWRCHSKRHTSVTVKNLGPGLRELALASRGNKNAVSRNLGPAF